MSDRLTIQIEGIDGLLDASAFTKVINTTLQILRHINAKMSDDTGEVSWHLVSLSKRSPAVVELQALIKQNGRVIDRDLLRPFVRGMNQLENVAQIPAYYDDDAMDKSRLLVLDRRISSIVFKNNGEVAEPTLHVAAHVSDLLRIHGYELQTSVDGVLDAIYAHGEPHFLVFDPITDSGIRCIFDEDMLEDVMRLMKRRVRVFGIARFNKRHEIVSLVAEEFERLPDQDEVPSLSDLHAAGIDITGDEDSAAYIDRIRDGE